MLDYAAVSAETYLRRALKKFTDVNSAIRADLPEEARVQQLNDLQRELIDGGDMVTKQLQPDQLLAHGLFVSVDKTQGKIKPTWPLPHLQEKCFEQYNVLLRHKPNQPVQSAAPILTLFTMPMTRLAFTLLALAMDQRMHLSFTPGTRVDEMYRAVFTDMEDGRGAGMVRAGPGAGGCNTQLRRFCVHSQHTHARNAKRTATRAGTAWRYCCH